MQGNDYVSDESSYSVHDEDDGNSFEVNEPFTLGKLQTARKRSEKFPQSSLVSSEHPSSSNSARDQDPLEKMRKDSERR